jgi:hypothetical protein
MNSTRLWRLHAAVVLATLAELAMKSANKLADVGPPPPCGHNEVRSLLLGRREAS